MNFSKDFIEAILETLKEENYDALHLALFKKPCGGKGLRFNFIKKDDSLRYINVEGILVAITEEDEAFFNNFYFDIDDDGNLLIKPTKDYKPEPCKCGGENCDDCEGCDEECQK